MEPSSPARVLLVDHDDEVRRLARLSLERDGRFSVLGDVFDAEAAAGLARSMTPDVIVVDLDLHGRTSLDLLVRLRDAAPTATVVAISARPTEELRSRISLLGGAGILERADVLAIAPILAHICGLRRRPLGRVISGADVVGGLDSSRRARRR
jgi:DNA-binding NarL/FixJ family response regulator